MQVTRGEMFKVGFTLQTQAISYAILINERRSLYFPVVTTPVHNSFIERIREEGQESLSLESYGFFFFLGKMWKAHGITPSQIILELDGDEGSPARLVCYVELCQSNELGLLMSHTDMLMQDAVVVSAICNVPVAIHATESIPIAFNVDMNKAKDGNIMASIRDDIIKMENGKDP